MQTIGTIESLWRYPVKSMAGERLAQVYMGFAGIYGDRCYAFKNSAARKGFPYLNASAQPQMLRYHPQFRFRARATMPPNWIEAMAIAPGANPTDADAETMALDVVTPDGTIFAIDDPALYELLVADLRGENQLTLVRSNRALTDCRPVSIVSLQTMRQLGEEMGAALDPRRFRANLYLDLTVDGGFAEDALVGHKLRIGAKAEVAVLERDPRCKILSLDPETGEHNPEIFRHVAQAHDACAGIYCAVLVEGVLAEGDAVAVID